MLYKIIQRVYDQTVRPYLPRKYGVYAGVVARDLPLFDRHDNHPDYKKGLIDTIHDQISPGDHAVLVGAGRGVTAVHLARTGARVTAIEAAEEMLAIARGTVALEGVSDCVEFRHALVGAAIEVYGELAGAETIRPSELNAGDVLVLDCEGAERSILSGLTDIPATVIVETHPERGVPATTTREILTDLGFRVSSRAYEPGESRPGKVVLVATRPTEEEGE